MAETVNYRLPDGTVVPIRLLTLHSDDREALSALNKYEAWARVASAKARIAETEKDSVALKLHIGLGVDAEKEKLTAFADFAEKYFGKSAAPVDDIRNKLVPAMTQDDMETIARMARQGANYERRILQSLWELDPLLMLESKLDLLVSSPNETDRAYLKKLVEKLSAAITNGNTGASSAASSS